MKLSEFSKIELYNHMLGIPMDGNQIILAEITRFDIIIGEYDEDYNAYNAIRISKEDIGSNVKDYEIESKDIIKGILK